MLVEGTLKLLCLQILRPIQFKFSNSTQYISAGEAVI